jgi:hypothetical protein
MLDFYIWELNKKHLDVGGTVGMYKLIVTTKIEKESLSFTRCGSNKNVGVGS